MCPALRCGRHDRGPDGFRERALNMSAVSHSAVGWHGVSRSSVRPIATFCCRPFTRDASGSGDRRGTVCLTAGYHGPHDMGHLLASATAASLRGRRCSRPSSQALACRLPGLTVRTTTVAPSTSNWRSRSSPWREIPPSRGLPAVDFCFGVRPSQAAR